MKRSHFNQLSVSVLIVLLSAGYVMLRSRSTDSSIQAIDDATDMPFDFNATVVDQDGRPLSGVRCSYTIGRFNSNWASNGGSGQRGNDGESDTISDFGGRLSVQGTGHDVIITRLKKDGYLRLFEESPSPHFGFPYLSLNERAVFDLSSHGKKGPYEPDPNRPAIFVMVKVGVKTAATLPSAGGSYPATQASGSRRRLEPIWPEVPSIPNLKYVRPGDTTH